MPQPPCLRLHVHAGVPRYVEDAVRRFARDVQAVVTIQHYIPVSLVYASLVHTDTGTDGFAAFTWYRNGLGEERCRIWLPGKIDWVARKLGIKPREFIPWLLGDFSHELAHYEQWRKGRKVTERGVRVRAGNILKAVRPQFGDCREYT